MKTELKLHFLLLLALLSVAHLAQAQGTAVTYQGRLTDSGLPANGSYDLTFAVFDASSDGGQVGDTLTHAAVSVGNGLFTVTLDFGARVFTGAARWLEIGVRTNGGDAFTSLIPRQAVSPAPYAIYAGSAGGVANGTVTADQLNTGGIPPAPGQFLSYDGGNFVWSDPDVIVGNVWSRNGATAYYNAGSVGIGTDSPALGILLDVNGPAILRPGGSGGGAVAFGTPNAETGMTMAENNRADIRFNDSTLKLVVGPAGGPPPSENGIAINTLGKVGIGTVSPTERLTVSGGGSDTKIEINAGGDTYAALRMQNFASSWLWQVTPWNDLPGGRLRLTEEIGGIEPISITWAGRGRVGIGATDPRAALHVGSGGLAVTGASSPYTGAGAGIFMESVGAGGLLFSYDYAASSPRNLLLNSPGGNVGIGTANPANKLHVNGNAAQARDKGGFVKAMAFIDPFLPADQYVVRCYNSQLADDAASTSPCGITVTRRATGFYDIYFGFNVEDRFISVTARESFWTGPKVGTIDSVAGNRVSVFFREVEQGIADSRFYIIVY